MSQSSKRDAEAAFGSTTNTHLTSTKRRKGKKHRKSDADLKATSIETKSLELGNAETSAQPEKAQNDQKAKLPTSPTDPIDEVVKSSKKKRRAKKNRESIAVHGPPAPGPTIPKTNGAAQITAAPNDRPGKTTETIPATSQTQDNTLQMHKKRKRRHSKGNNIGSGTLKSSATGNELVHFRSKPNPAKQKSRNQLVSDLPHRIENGWTLSKGIGGSFIKHDPLLVEDGQYLILPTDVAVQIYSSATSLLVRSLPITSGTMVIGCVLSKLDASRLLIATSEGTVSLWNWTDGCNLSQWNLRKGLRQIVSVPSLSDDESILALHQDQNNICTLVAYSLDKSNKTVAECKTLLSRKGLQPTIRLFAESGLIIACARNNLLLGHAPDFESSRIEELSFTWRELPVNGGIVSFDARTNTQKVPSSKRAPAVDIVLGLQTGIILLHEDILFKMIGKEKAATNADVLARRLHWHRNGVKTVKWSRDGNYLISGGSETVLVIWQLDTNEKQFLPHLSTSILNLTVSAAGSAYAMLLGDNSVMILSTADLLPSTNISGLAMARNANSHLSAILHPKSPNQLLLAVPTTSTDSRGLRDSRATLVQTYDIVSDFQRGRQALARNLTTTVNVGPDGRAIKEPDVSHLRISYDGKWLATVDHWRPDPKDLRGLYLADDEDASNEGLETCLKFWAYSEEQQVWELVTRVNEPHGRDGGFILDMNAHPTKVEFVTIGSDSTLRIWSPKARVRDGVSVRDESGGQLYNWSCSQTVHCPEASTLTNQVTEVSAAVAYAGDASITVASWSRSGSDTRYTHLIDSRSGEIRLSVPDLATSGNARFAFAGRHLLCLSQTFKVFDTINAEVTLVLDLGADLRGPLSKGYLANNDLDGTFAIGLNSTKPGQTGRVIVFDASKMLRDPIVQVRIEGQVKALLSDPLAPGYVIVDGHSRIRRLQKPGMSSSLALTTATEPDQVTRSLDSIFGSASVTKRVAPSRFLTSTEDANISRTLEDVLGFQTSSEAPPVGELFDRIAGVFAASAVAA